MEGKKREDKNVKKEKGAGDKQCRQCRQCK